jgi:hypothetical protein
MGCNTVVRRFCTLRQQIPVGIMAPLPGAPGGQTPRKGEQERAFIQPNAALTLNTCFLNGALVFLLAVEFELND